MRRKFISLSVALVLFCGFAIAQNNKQPIGKITFPLNRVFVISPGSSILKYARFNMDVFAGDKIDTKKESRCEITLLGGSIIRIDENSIFTLEAVEVENDEVKQVESFLSIGKIWANIKKIFSGEDYFKVKSPSAVIAVRGTIYRVNANKDTTTEVRVYDGEVQVEPFSAGLGLEGAVRQAPVEPTEVPPPTEVSGPTEVSPETWVEIVKAQQQIYVHPDGSFEKSDYDTVKDAELGWVLWNKRRDALTR